MENTGSPNVKSHQQKNGRRGREGLPEHRYRSCERNRGRGPEMEMEKKKRLLRQRKRKRNRRKKRIEASGSAWFELQSRARAGEESEIAVDPSPNNGPVGILDYKIWGGSGGRRRIRGSGWGRGWLGCGWDEGAEGRRCKVRERACKNSYNVTCRSL